MKLRDNLALLPVVGIGLSLELFILAAYLLGSSGTSVVIDAGRFLLVGQLYLAGACILGYVFGRKLIRPLESILEGISEYGRGRMDHRIQRSKISEFDRLAEQLNAMAVKLEEVDALKNDIIANVSHELRSPLAASEGYLNLLLEHIGAEGTNRDNLLKINANLSRLRRLVENLLDVSQIEARSLHLRLEPVDLAVVAREVAALFALQLKTQQLTLAMELPENLPEAQADPLKVRQVFNNLIDNGIKYNRPGGQLRIGAASAGDFLQVWVQDTGIGIPPEHLETVFERFRRLNRSPEKAKVKGAGLGLAISRGLAREMGGDLRVESALNAGSRFILTLPANKPAAVEPVP